LNTFKKIWEYKILIISNIIIFVLIAHLYVNFIFNNYKFISIIAVKNYPFELLDIYNKKLSRPERTFHLDFNSDYNLNLLSYDNLNDFLEQSKIEELNGLKKFLISNNISSRAYFADGNFGLYTSDKKENVIKYFVHFPYEKGGDIFLNNYIIFTKNKTLNTFKNKLRLLLEDKITNYEENLEIAKKLNLLEPVLIRPQSDNDGLYYKGSKVLIEEIKFYKILKKNLDNNTLDYNPILDVATSPYKVNKVYKYYYSAVTFSIFLSFVIIFFRTKFRKV
jgi:LPS O-antigen subunit length determinant protein (WzzB/FepE family)